MSDVTLPDIRSDTGRPRTDVFFHDPDLPDDPKTRETPPSSKPPVDDQRLQRVWCVKSLYSLNQLEVPTRLLL